MTSEEVKSYLIKLENNIEFIFDLKNNHIFKFELTPVGIAIAIANFKQKLGFDLNWPYSMRDY